MEPLVCLSIKLGRVGIPWLVKKKKKKKKQNRRFLEEQETIFHCCDYFGPYYTPETTIVGLLAIDKAVKVSKDHECLILYYYIIIIWIGGSHIEIWSNILVIFGFQRMSLSHSCHNRHGFIAIV